jgi:hypothetical protein
LGFFARGGIRLYFVLAVLESLPQYLTQKGTAASDNDGDLFLSIHVK